MRGRLASALALALTLLTAPAHAAVRDDTDLLQAKLDAGGAIFIPKLAGGECYRTRGLWLSRDDTTITSDGACIVAVGFGPARLDPGAKHPHFADAVFYMTHSTIRAPVPARVSISGLRITVPKATRMNGIFVGGHEATLSNLTIDGAPRRAVLVGSGAVGAGGISARIAITGNTFTGAQRDGIAVYGPIGLRVEGNTVAHAHASGIAVYSADRGQPVLDTHIVDNTIRGSGGPGILRSLAPKNGASLLTSPVELRGNVFHRNRGGAVVTRRSRVNKKGPGVYTVAPPSSGDDTSWLQARLDRGGGTIFLPRLLDGHCYATRGLWVSHDDTTITSDGACIVSLGLGPVRLHSVDGDPIAADAVFFVNRSDPKRPAPINVTISNLHVTVAPGQPMYGVAVFGHRVTLSHLAIDGLPKDDVTISGRANGNSYAGDISVLDSTLSGAARNAISATGVIGLDIERNTIEGVRDASPGQPAAGIDIEPDTRDRPALDVRIAGNTIQDNAGPGILLELEPNEGPAVIATGLEISGNTIVRNSNKPTPPKRAGIVIAGGQDGGGGTLLLKDNVIRDNGGPPLFETHLKLVVDASGNQFG
jgi:Right handed beta helix region